MTESREFRIVEGVIPLSILLSLFHPFAFSGPTGGGSSGDPATFEAVTGDSPDEDKTLWDSFYKRKSNAFGKEAVSFLKNQIQELPQGRAFVPAMGEGRNAIFLAKHGFSVDGNDISEVAVDHALHEAKVQKVSIKGIVADLNDYSYPEGYYDLVVVSLFYSERLVPKFKKAVKKGGYLMFYNRIDTGSAKNKKMISPDDFLVKTAELKLLLKDFKIKVFKEYKDQGVDVVGVLAQKP